MNRNIALLAIPLAAALSYASIPQSFAADVRFIPATPENTTFIDGSPVNTKEGEGDWKWLPGEGNQGVFESYGDPKKNAPGLIVHAKDLEPNRDYEVFGFFWTHGFGPAPALRGKQPHHWPARFGTSIATLTTYGGRTHPNVPWIICPESKTGIQLGYTAVLEEKNPLVKDVPNWITAVDDTRLIRARLGISRADKEGNLPVYVDDFPDSKFCGKTRIDGVAVRPAPKNSKAIVGTGNEGMMHLSLRARDWLGTARELAAGADPNALDYKGRTALFHPVAMGDRDTVERLLKAGVKPDVEGQSISALAAAASIGDADMLEFLLAQGCKMPSGKVDENGQLSRFHPAIGAIRVGSLKSLKVILKHCPDLEFEKLGRRPKREMYIQEIEGNGYSFRLVSAAVAHGHDELAAFLVDQGCDLDTSPLIGKYSIGYGMRSNLEPYSLLARTVTEGESLQKTREAILRRGVNPVRDASLAAERSHEYGIIPWDGLSAAVAIGDANLTARFLHQAGVFHPLYQRALLAMAMWSGDPQIVDLLAKRFPEVAPSILTLQAKDHATNDPKPDRIYLPRKTPLPANQTARGESWTLAVLAAGEASGPATLLESEASNAKFWKVVDRETIKQALLESKLSKPWEEGSHRLYEFGDLIAADLMVIVTQGGNGKNKLLRFEAIDVASGLSIAREHIEDKAFGEGQSIKSLLDRFHASLQNARAGNHPTAVTLLPFSVNRDIQNSQALTGLFRASVEAEVDSTPGMLTVGMDEIQSIAGEQALGGEGSFWAAAMTLEGGLEPVGENKVSLTLRLRSMGSANQGIHDQTETGNLADLSAMAALAWKKLMKQAGVTSETAAANHGNAGQKKNEAERLLREAEWLISQRNAKEALPLLERAHLLGADPEKQVSLHYKAITDFLDLGPPVPYDRLLRAFGLGHALTPHAMDLLLHSLNDLQAMLDQMHYYLVHHGQAAAKWKSPEMWKTVQEMNAIRSSLPKVLPDGVSVEKVRQLSDAVDRMTEDYFKLRRSIKPPSLYLSKFDTFSPLANASMLRRNPKFREEWVNMLFAVAKNEYNGYFQQSELIHFLGNVEYSDSYGFHRLFAEAALDRFSEYSGPHREFQELALKILSSSGDERIQHIRKYLAIYSNMGRRERHRLTLWLHPRDLMKHYGMGAFPYQFKCPLAHPHSGIASLSHEPIGAMDWIWNPMHGGRELVEFEESSLAETGKYLRLNPIEDSHQNIGDEICERRLEGTTMEQLLGEVLVIEQVYGRPIYKSLTDRWKRLYPDFGKATDKLPARLLVDLRQLDDLRPGTFCLPMPDQKDINKLWLYYQPYNREQHREVDGSYDVWFPLIRQPWLVGLECTTGKIATRVNLATAPGVDPKAALENTSPGGIGDNALLVQTDQQIFTQVWWYGTSLDSEVLPLTGALIDKESGEFIKLSQKVTIWNTRQFFTGGSSSGAVSIGQQFYFFSEGDRLSHLAYPYVSLMALSPSGEVNHVSKYGRRPEQTPFDLEDRAPNQIFADGKRLFIAKTWGHAGHYDPSNNSWTMLKGSPEQIKKTGHQLATTAYRKLLFPSHKIAASHEFPELTVAFDNTFPDQLEFSHPRVGNLRVALDLEIPEGFADQPFFPRRIHEENRDRNLPPVYYSYGDRMKPVAFHLAVLHQTKDDLLIGLQDGIGFHWGSGKRTGVFFPMIWAISKSDLREALQAMASK